MTNSIVDWLNGSTPQSVLTNAKVINDTAFKGCENLVGVNMPNAAAIGYQAFQGCRNLSSVVAPQVTKIGSEAFASCSIANGSFPEAVLICASAFASASLGQVSFPKVTAVMESAFKSCRLPSSMEFPNLTYIAESAFGSATNLTSISLPNAIYLKSYAFQDCRSLETVSLPNAIAFDGGAFSYAGLHDIYAPQLQSMSDACFAYNYGLRSVSFPYLRCVPRSAFSTCWTFSYARFSMVEEILSAAFSGCNGLFSLYLLGSKVVKAGSTIAFAFSGTPISSSYYNSHTRLYEYMKVYVRPSLYNEYISTAPWADVSSRIFSYEGD